MKTKYACLKKIYHFKCLRILLQMKDVSHGTPDTQRSIQDVQL